MTKSRRCRLPHGRRVARTWPSNRQIIENTSFSSRCLGCGSITCGPASSRSIFRFRKSHVPPGFSRGPRPASNFVQSGRPRRPVPSGSTAPCRGVQGHDGEPNFTEKYPPEASAKQIRSIDMTTSRLEEAGGLRQAGDFPLINHPDAEPGETDDIAVKTRTGPFVAVPGMPRCENGYGSKSRLQKIHEK
jgi:hypothetical protein